MNKLFCEEQEQTRMRADIVLIYGKCATKGESQDERSPEINYTRGSRTANGVMVKEPRDNYTRGSRRSPTTKCRGTGVGLRVRVKLGIAQTRGRDMRIVHSGQE